MDNPIETPSTNEPKLKPKQKYEGKVMKTSLQGAIVDIGENLPGFLHISRLSIALILMQQSSTLKMC